MLQNMVTLLNQKIIIMIIVNYISQFLFGVVF